MNLFRFGGVKGLSYSRFGQRGISRKSGEDQRICTNKVHWHRRGDGPARPCRTPGGTNVLWESVTSVCQGPKQAVHGSNETPAREGKLRKSRPYLCGAAAMWTEDARTFPTSTREADSDGKAGGV